MAEVFTRRINIYVDSGQAEAAYQTLITRQDRLTAEVKRYADAGKEAPAKLKTALDETTAAVERQRKKLSGELAPSLRDLNGTYSRLTRELNAMSKEDAGFEKKRKETLAAKAALDQYRGSLSQVGKGFADMLRTAGGVAFGVLIGNTVQAGLQTVSSYISGFFTRIAKLSDELADIRKTTNLSAKEVEDLNKKLSGLDTRTSTSDLRGIAAVGGQFAVAKKDLADFTREVDRVNVALGDKFGNNAETVATEMSKLRNIFKDVKTQNIAEDILHIGNALNELENNGAATSDVIADFSNRIGGIGIPLGLTSGQVLGISATLQELGVNAERGGTAVSKILQKMTVNVKDFSQIAGLSVEDFSKLLNTDLFEAFSKVIEGSQKGGASATALASLLKDAELSGSGASEVFLKLGTNTSLMAEKVKLASSALQSNASIMQEFNAKNRNTAGELEILNKRIAAAFASPELNKAIGGLIHELIRLTEATDNNVKSAQREYQQLILLESKIMDVNTPQEERVRMVKDLQAQYPGYLSNINAETASTNELTTAFVALNNQMIARITLAAQQDKIEAAQKKASDIQVKRLEQEDKARELMADAIRQFGLDQAKILKEDSLGKQVQETIRQINEMRDSLGFVKFAALDNKGIFQEITIAQGFLNRYVAEENKAIEQSKKLLNDKLDLAKRLGIEQEKQGSFLVQPSGTFPRNTPGGGVTIVDDKKEASKLEALLNEAQRFRDKVQQLERESEALQEGKNEREVQKAKEKFIALELEAERLQKKFSDEGFGNLYSKKKLEEDLANIRRLRDEEISVIKERQFTNRTEEELAATQRATIRFYEQEKTLLKEKYAEGLITRREYDEGIEQMDSISKQVQVQNFLDYYDTLQAAYQDDADKLAQLEAEKVKLKNASYEQDYNNFLRNLERKRAEEIAQDNANVINAQTAGNPSALRDARLAQLENNLAFELALYADNEAKKNEIIARAAAERQQIEQDYFSSIIFYAEEAASAMGNIWSGINRIQANLDAADLARDRRVNDEKKRNLQKQLDGKRISRLQYDKQIEALDKQYAEKEAEIKRKAFQKEKAAKIVMATINTALSVINALATAPWPVNIVMAALAAATGAVQIGVISSQKSPEFGKGEEEWRAGIGGKKHRHRSRGNPVIDPETGEELGKLEEGEAIIPADSTAANKPLIRALIAAQGRNITDRYPFRRTGLNVSRTAENVMFERGGIFGQQLALKAGMTPEAKPTEQITLGYLMEFTRAQTQELKAELQKAQDKKIIFVKEDYDRFNRHTDETILRTTFDRG